jgi:hypothetical protein
MVKGLTAGGEGRIGEGGLLGRTRVERNYGSGPIHGMARTGIGTRVVLYLCRAHTAFLLTTSISCFSAFTTCRDREGTAG